MLEFSARRFGCQSFRRQEENEKYSRVHKKRNDFIIQDLGATSIVKIGEVWLSGEIGEGGLK